MRNPQIIKLFLITALCTSFIFSFSYFGTAAYGKIFSDQEEFASGTFIGNEDVTGMDKSQVLTYITEKQAQWVKETVLSLQFQEVTKDVKDIPAFYQFDIEQSISLAVSGKKNQLIAKIDEEKLNAILEEILPELYAEGIDQDTLIADLLIYATLLESGNHTIKLQNYLSGDLIEDEVIAESSTKISGKENVINMWEGNEASIEVAPHSQISFLDLAEERGGLQFEADEMSIISSALYKALLNTNFMITERHIGRLLPGYIDPGFEARVDSEKQMDFIFTNPNDHKYVINFQQLDKLLYVSVKGPKTIYTYQPSLKDKQTFKPKTIIQIDAKLPFGQKRIGAEGKEGILIHVFRDQLDEAGKIISTEKIAEDFYPPVHEVLIYSLAFKKDKADTDLAEIELENSVSIEEEKSESDDEKTSAEQKPDKKQNETDSNKGTSKNENENDEDLWGLGNEAVK
ncbi:VanW family protein [Cytobacillus oceanisediminis]|uniref:VanW family protein n=1 Tax=Cytobacillus oceanisediminis TaxID=665099 RepID=UPI001D14E5C5|nr:VanW family protein [Cytobacillus oceanisediminis]MCC3647494.1 VanW family protein [Cytobacillus oceanisediminis]